MFRQFITAIVISVMMGNVATAQTAPKTDKQTETARPAPKQDTSKEAKEKAKPKDLDTFFKEAEKQVEEGPTCEPVPEPIV